MAGIEIAKKEDLENFQEQLNQKSDENHSHSWDDIKDKPTIPDTSDLATKDEVNGKADTDHTHSYNDLTDKPDIPSIDGLAKEEDLNDYVTIAQFDALQSLAATLQDTVTDLSERLSKLEPEITIETETENIDTVTFSTVRNETDELPKGEEQTVQEGVNGYTKVTYEVTYEDGVETKREETNREVIDPIDEIINVGTFEEPEPEPEPEPEEPED